MKREKRKERGKIERREYSVTRERERERKSSVVPENKGPSKGSFLKIMIHAKLMNRERVYLILALRMPGIRVASALSLFFIREPFDFSDGENRGWKMDGKLGSFMELFCVEYGFRWRR